MTIMPPPKLLTYRVGPSMSEAVPGCNYRGGD